ncbi:hypothetical protein ANCDUO_26241, partial [Ancylostoma duodenale]
LDWMYMWSALYQMNPWLITSNKISLKAQLQSLPGAAHSECRHLHVKGFGMSAAHFLFLQRNMEKDAVTFDSAIDYYKAATFPRGDGQVSLDDHEELGVRKEAWSEAPETPFVSSRGWLSPPFDKDEG